MGTPSTALQTGTNGVTQPMRSYVEKPKAKVVDAFYSPGEKAFMTHDNKNKGNFQVTIASEGRWNEAAQDVEYQVKLNEKEPFYKDKEGREWFLEAELGSK